MDIGKYKKHYGFLRSTQKFHIISNTVLVIALSASLYANTQQDTIVINGVSEHCEERAISSNWMNEANHKKLGFTLAIALGNITPETAKYTNTAVMEYIAPSIYNEVKQAIHTQLQGIVVDRLTMQFFPEKSFVEDGITFVTGKGVLTGPTGKAQKYTRTYEFEFDVQNYTPTVTYLTVYDDVPKDREWKRRHAKREQK